jgi:NADPH:quinone reductase-like Zn-dependent oxidoreductase
MDQTFPLDDGAAAMAHVATGHAQGKTVITM